MNTELLPFSEQSAKKAAEIMAAGGVVGIPTETVYGLAADARNEAAVRSIFEAKGRPQDNPLIVHISALEQLPPLVREIPELALKIAEKYWPGPLTMIFPKSDMIPAATSGGLDTVAVRMPESPAARAIIDACGFPRAAPSANLSGSPSPTTAQHVMNDMNGRIPLIIDGGECRCGVESTVLCFPAADRVRILRPGGVTAEMLAELCQADIDPAVTSEPPKGAKVMSPGMKYKHYAPDAQVIVGTGSLPDMAAKLIAEYDRREAEGLTCIIFATEETRCFYRGKRYVIIGERKNPLTLCESLFAQFRAQEGKADVILCEALPETDMGLAYMNRLLRSAGFKTI